MTNEITRSRKGNPAQEVKPTELRKNRLVINSTPQRGRSGTAPLATCGWCGWSHGSDERGLAIEHAGLLRSRLRLQGAKRQAWRDRVGWLLTPIPVADLIAVEGEALR